MKFMYKMSLGHYSWTPYLSDNILRPLIKVILREQLGMWCAPSHAHIWHDIVVNFILCEPLSLRLLEEDNKPGKQSSRLSMGLLNVMVYFAYLS